MHPVRDLFGRAEAGLSAPSAEAGAELSIGFRCVPAGPLLLRMLQSVYRGSILGKSTHPPELCLDPRNVWTRHNFGSGCDRPIGKLCFHRVRTMFARIGDHENTDMDKTNINKIRNTNSV